MNNVEKGELQQYENVESKMKKLKQKFSWRKNELEIIQKARERLFLCYLIRVSLISNSFGECAEEIVEYFDLSSPMEENILVA